MKFKALLLSSVVAFSGAANAAIEGATAGASNSYNSDLVVMIYDKVKDIAFIQDLNKRYFNDILSANGSFSGSFSLQGTSVFSTSASSDLVWGMFATDADDNAATTYGYVSTGSLPPVDQDYSTLNGVNGLFTQIAIASNVKLGANGVSTAFASNSTSGAIGNFLNNYGQQVTGEGNSAKVSQAQSLVFHHLDDNFAPVTGGATSVSANPWVLDWNAKTLSSAPAATGEVPLPAAAWLMISALLGLGGIARRRNA